MKINREKEYIAERVYDKFEVLHNNDLRELIDKFNEAEYMNDLEDLTNHSKLIANKIIIQCKIIELIMQEDWSLEEIKMLDWISESKKEDALKLLVEYNIESKADNVINNLKQILKTLYTLGDTKYE